VATNGQPYAGIRKSISRPVTLRILVITEGVSIPMRHGMIAGSVSRNRVTLDLEVTDIQRPAGIMGS
jgi:hypothetical protein